VSGIAGRDPAIGQDKQTRCEKETAIKIDSLDQISSLLREKGLTLIDKRRLTIGASSGHHNTRSISNSPYKQVWAPGGQKKGVPGTPRWLRARESENTEICRHGSCQNERLKRLWRCICTSKDGRALHFRRKSGPAERPVTEDFAGNVPRRGCKLSYRVFGAI